MNTNNLRNRFISKTFDGYGTYKVTFTYYGKNYTFKTHNMEAIDRIKNDDGTEDAQKDHKQFYSTIKQAYIALYEEGKRSCGIA